VVPANPQTTYQKTVRANLKTASQLWDTIGQPAQLSWISAAEGYNSKARLGMSGKLTGNQYFVRINANLLDNSGETVTTPPALAVFTEIPATALVATNPGGVPALKITTTDVWQATTRVKASLPVKNGVHRMPETFLIGTAPVSANSASNITALYVAKFGAPPVASKVFIELYVETLGQQSAPMAFWAVIPAST
jgi:hypothetical protein